MFWCLLDYISVLSLQPCHHCHGNGKVRCTHCHGRGLVCRCLIIMIIYLPMFYSTDCFLQNKFRLAVCSVTALVTVATDGARLAMEGEEKGCLRDKLIDIHTLMCFIFSCKNNKKNISIPSFRCVSCHGKGYKGCLTCNGHRNLVHFIQLTITW